MTRRIAVMVLSLLCAVLESCTSVSYRQTHYLYIPTNLDSIRSADKVDLPTVERRYEGEDGFYLEYSERCEFFGEYQQSKALGVYTKHIRYVILNPEEQTLSTFSYELSGEQVLQAMYALVVQPDGKVKRFTKEDCKVQTTGKSTSYRIAYPNIQKGSVIEEAVEVKGQLSSIYFFQRSLPVQKLQFVVSYPKDWNLKQRKTHAVHTPVLKFALDEQDALNIQTYTASNVPAWKSEPYSPYRRDVVPYTDLRFYRSGKYEYSWEDIGGYLGAYSADNDENMSEKVKEYGKRMTTHCTTKEQMLDTVVLAIQSTLTAVSPIDDSYERAAKRTNFAELLEGGDANPASIVGLSQALLRHNGIESSMVMLCDKSDGYFDEYDPETTSFWGMALYVRIDKKSFLVFPTQKDIPPSYVPEIFQGCRALLLRGWKPRETYYAARCEATFLTLETDNMVPSTLHSTFKLALKEDGTMKLKEVHSYHGSDAYFYRKEFRTMSPEARAKRVKEMMSYSDGDSKVEGYMIDGLDQPLLPLVVTIEYTINNLLTVTPEEVIFQTSGLFSPTSEAKWKFETSKRENPIQIHVNSRLTKHIQMTFPKNWSVVTELKDVEIKNEMGNLEVKYQKPEQGLLNISLERHMKRTVQPKETLPNLVDLVGKRSSLQVPSILFRVSENR